MSAITDYEVGLLRVLPFPGHRFFDLVVGVALAGCTWHFAMNGRSAVVFTVFGIVALATTFLTRRPRGETGKMA